MCQLIQIHIFTDSFLSLPALGTQSPGGSSAGTASGIAAGIAPVGLGSDTMGSLRVPAASCGIVGFRPSRGRWPGGGVVPINSLRDTPGPMAQSVADLVLLDGAVTGDTVITKVYIRYYPLPS